MIRTLFPNILVKTLNYGIKPITCSEKIKNSFIYSSFPNRGLSILLKMWEQIVSFLPDATLHIYCDLENKWVNEVAPEEIDFIKNFKYSGIYHHGWVSKETLTEAWKTSEYWLYPCIFKETFCMTALEAASTKTFVISNNLAALSETVGDRGLVVQGDASTQEWQDRVIKEFKNLTPEFKQQKIEINYDWSKKLTWENQATNLI